MDAPTGKPCALLVLGAAGMRFAQRTCRAAPLPTRCRRLGPRAHPAALLATGVLGERITTTPGHLAAELAGGLVARMGVVVLGRSPLVLGLYEQQGRRRQESVAPRQATGRDRAQRSVARLGR